MMQMFGKYGVVSSNKRREEGFYCCTMIGKIVTNIMEEQISNTWVW